jgi:NADH dehydrogenase FAD-containing subunit
MVPLSSLLKNGKVMHGEVTSVDKIQKTVILADGTSIKWDILCVASGSRNLSPAEPPATANTKEQTKAYFTAMHSALANAKNIVVVGGGAVSIELAGEIRSYGVKGAKITMVTQSDALLNGPINPSESNLASVNDLLAKEGIEVIYNDYVVSESFPANPEIAIPIVSTPTGVTLKSGKTIPSDLLVWAAGSRAITSFLPSEWLDNQTKEVIVDTETLKLKFRDDVFCLGDCAKTNAGKLGYIAGEDAKVVSANILSLVQGKQPSAKVWRMNAFVMALPFGPEKGRLLLSYFALGDWITSTLKGYGLFTKRVWGEMAPSLTPPSA